MVAGTGHDLNTTPNRPQGTSSSEASLWVYYILPLLGLWLLARPLVSFLTQGWVVVTAALLNQVSNLDAILFQADFLPFDKIYLSVFLRVLSNIQAEGLAVAGRLGEWLHWNVPDVFETPVLVANGAWVSAFLTSGSSVLAVFLSRLLARLLLFFVGAAMTQSAQGTAQPWFLSHHAPKRRLQFLLGLILQAEALVGMGRVVIATPDVDLDTMGFALVATKVLKLAPLDYDSYVGFAARILLLLGLALGVGLLLYLTTRPWRRRSVSEEVTVASDDHRAGPLRSELAAMRMAPRFQAVTLLVVAVSVAISPVRYVAPGDLAQVGEGLSDCPISSTAAECSAALRTTSAGEYAAYQPIEEGTPPGGPTASKAAIRPSIGGPSDTSPAARAPSIIAPPANSAGSLVSISGQSYRYTLYVNGAPQVLRGVGYNPTFRQLPTEERAARYSRDFRAIAAAGFNTILGWNQEEFDGLVLQKAHEYGLGVLLPYDLPPQAAYSNSETTERLKRDVAAWVEKHKNAPSLRMWAIGNEVLHDMKDKSQAAAFSRFYAELVSMVHEMDPAHPVLYRDAEDAYVGLLRSAFRDAGARRYWLVYGMNIFTYRMTTALPKWPDQGLDVALLISEFGPTGLTRQARPGGYMRMWKTMMKEPGQVLGGFAYVWSTAGPEVLDRTYGLVDEKGEPTDGSLAALAAQHWREIEATSKHGEP